MLQFRAPKTLRECIRLTEGMTNLEECELLYKLRASARRLRRRGRLLSGPFDGRPRARFARRRAAARLCHRAPCRICGRARGQFGPADRAAFYRAMLRTGCFQCVRLVNLSSEMVAPNWTLPVVLLFIDGDHSEDGVRRDWANWSPRLTAEAVVAFDDSDWPGPAKLIKELCSIGWQQIDECEKIVVLQRK